MRLGILSDTHNELARTKSALQLLRDQGAESLIHCGDLSSGDIVEALSVLPCWFVFGNHDADEVPQLQRAALEFGPVCLGWGGLIELGGKRLGVVHGHMSWDLRRLIDRKPDFLFSGHDHFPSEKMLGNVRRINPGALHRADQFTVALVDLETGEVNFLPLSE